MKKQEAESGGVESVPRVIGLRALAPGETEIARRIGRAVGATTAVATIFSIAAGATWVTLMALWTVVGSWF